MATGTYVCLRAQAYPRRNGFQCFLKNLRRSQKQSDCRSGSMALSPLPPACPRGPANGPAPALPPTERHVARRTACRPLPLTERGAHGLVDCPAPPPPPPTHTHRRVTRPSAWCSPVIERGAPTRNRERRVWPSPLTEIGAWPGGRPGNPAPRQQGLSL